MSCRYFKWLHNYKGLNASNFLYISNKIKTIIHEIKIGIDNYGYYIVNCIWASWSTWSACSITCGTGTKHRVRVIQTHEENGGTCSGDAVETSQENCGTCPAG